MIKDTQVSAVLLKDITEHYDVKVTIKGKSYIVPVERYRGNTIKFDYDFSSLPCTGDESALMNEITKVIDCREEDDIRHLDNASAFYS